MQFRDRRLHVVETLRVYAIVRAEWTALAGGDEVPVVEIEMCTEGRPLLIERDAVSPPSLQNTTKAAAGVLFAREFVVPAGEEVEHVGADAIGSRLRRLRLLSEDSIDHRCNRMAGAGVALLSQNVGIQPAVDGVVQKLKTRPVRQITRVEDVRRDVCDE